MPYRLTLPSDADPAAARVFRAFVSDGRVARFTGAAWPATLLLDEVAQRFEPGLRYPEEEVDRRLRDLSDDHVALRRYLVDEPLLSRRNGIYHRRGGPVRT